MNFELHQPRTIEGALRLAAELSDECRFIAGGTDLVVQIRRGRRQVANLIDLSQLSGLNQIHSGADAYSIGALVTHKALERFPDFRGSLSMIAEAAHVVGGHQVRNVATVGGNIVNASPAADVVVPLLALDAELTLTSVAGERRVLLDDFLLGPGKTGRRADEMLTAIRVAKPVGAAGSAFIKSGRRKAMEISVVCVAAYLQLVGDTCNKARISLGAVGPRTLRARIAEGLLEGQNLTTDRFQSAARQAAEEGSPLTDVRASAGYRKHLVEVLVERALQRAFDRARGASE